MHLSGEVEAREERVQDAQVLLRLRLRLSGAERRGLPPVRAERTSSGRWSGRQRREAVELDEHEATARALAWREELLERHTRSSLNYRMNKRTVQRSDILVGTVCM